MKTREEWLAIFRDLGFDYGDIWHLMDGLCALRMITPTTKTKPGE